MHRATKESGLTESADGSIARRAQRAGALGHGLEPPRRPLTNTAFSWKFAEPLAALLFSHLAYTKDVPGGQPNMSHPVDVMPPFEAHTPSLGSKRPQKREGTSLCVRDVPHEGKGRV